MGILEGLDYSSIMQASGVLAEVRSMWQIKRTLDPTIKELVIPESIAVQLAIAVNSERIKRDEVELNSGDSLMILGLQVKTEDAKLVKGDGTVVEANVESGGFIFGPNYQEDVYENGYLVRSTFWAAWDGTQYSKKFQETTNLVEKSTLLSETVKKYNRDGDVISSVSKSYSKIKSGDTTTVSKR